MSDYQPATILRRLIRIWSEASIAFYSLPVLMIILLLGTLAQRWLDLYRAQQIFFSSAFIWIGPIPLPGTPCLLGVMLLSLTLKFIFHSDWRWRKAGIHLSHLGVIILLCGAVATAWFAEEGSITLLRDQETRTITDFHERRLIISDNNQQILSLHASELQKDRTLNSQLLPFHLQILDSCRDCTVIPTSTPPVDAHGMARAGKLAEQQSNTPNEAMIYGIRFHIDGTNSPQDGQYMLLDVARNPVIIRQDGHEYRISFNKAVRELPFGVTLNDFERAYYPGTDKAQSFSSQITVHDGGTSWPVMIEMNKPLRYKGYTLFQSSFVDTADGTASVLSVVKNQGWIFPYLGTAVIFAGLLLHLIISLRNKS